MPTPITAHTIPRFNPLYQVFFIREADCVFFADAYPFPFQYITGAHAYALLGFVDSKRSIAEITRKMNGLSEEQVINALNQLHEKKLVLFG